MSDATEKAVEVIALMISGGIAMYHGLTVEEAASVTTDAMRDEMKGAIRNIFRSLNLIVVDPKLLDAVREAQWTSDRINARLALADAVLASLSTGPPK